MSSCRRLEIFGVQLDSLVVIKQRLHSLFLGFVYRSSPVVEKEVAWPDLNGGVEVFQIWVLVAQELVEQRSLAQCVRILQLDLGCLEVVFHGFVFFPH